VPMVRCLRLAWGVLRVLVTIANENILRPQLLIILVRHQCDFIFLRMRASLLKPALHLRRIGTQNPWPASLSMWRSQAPCKDIEPMIFCTMALAFSFWPSNKRENLHQVSAHKENERKRIKARRALKGCKPDEKTNEHERRFTLPVVNGATQEVAAGRGAKKMHIHEAQVSWPASITNMVRLEDEQPSTRPDTENFCCWGEHGIINEDENWDLRKQNPAIFRGALLAYKMWNHKHGAEMSWEFILIFFSQTNTRETRDVCRASNAETHQTQIEILCSSTSLVLASSSIVAHIVCSHKSDQSNNDHHTMLSKNVTTRWLI
jgi:hypothetical protein